MISKITINKNYFENILEINFTSKERMIDITKYVENKDSFYISNKNTKIKILINTIQKINGEGVYNKKRS